MSLARLLARFVELPLFVGSSGFLPSEEENFRPRTRIFHPVKFKKLFEVGSVFVRLDVGMLWWYNPDDEGDGGTARFCHVLVYQFWEEIARVTHGSRGKQSAAAVSNEFDAEHARAKA
jgi:hypothetical protein